ncbi:MAG: exosome complex RNA-binding protein Csl4 [Nitrososphaerota archaeon]|nr:exosome complex RNA-binding protein Csl4 [Nitrososphaerota archaeon]
MVEENHQIALPGDRLCVLEEFLSGKGTKTSPDGVVFATVIGRIKFDKKKREVHVEAVKEPDNVAVGDVVLGEVKELQSRSAIIKIIGKNGRLLKHHRTAILLAKPGSKESLGQYVSVGDVLLAKVTNMISGLINVSIWDQDLGVIQAMCDNCGSTMMNVKKDKYNVYCPKCKKFDTRKMVIQRGNEKKLFSWLGSAT